MKNPNSILKIFFISFTIFLFSCAHTEKNQFSNGYCAYKKGDLKTALYHYNQVLDKNPESSKAYVRRSDIWIKWGKFDLAVSDTSKALEIDPNYAEAYLNSCSALRELGLLDRAISDCNKGIGLQPNNDLAYELRGNVYFNKSEFDLAILDFSKAINLNPESLKAYRDRAFAWYEKNQFKNVIGDLERAIKLNPEDSGVLNSLGWVLATCPIEKFIDGNRAIQLAEKSVKIRKSHFNLNTLAAAYATSGNFNKAIEIQSRAINLLKNNTSKDEFWNRYTAQLEYYKSRKPWRDK